MRSIRVTNASGEKTTVHEYEEREFQTKKHRFSLESGELVQKIGGCFVVVETGERLKPS